ncbi:MAG: lysophospholipid acyltransferase family protein [Bacteriovorax sp.]
MITGLIRQLIKAPCFAFLLLAYFSVSFFIYLLCGLDFGRSRPYLIKVISFCSRVGLKIIGINVVQNIRPANLDLEDNYLIVSNHLSYIDVLIIGGFFPSCFVTSKEMKETFFLGQICMLGGCLFVDRKNRNHLHREVKELTDALEGGHNVAIFPEATSTDGSSVIRFRRPLFQAAIDARSKILPVCLNYRAIDASPVTIKNRDTVFWYGDMTFLDHILKLFSFKKMSVELTVLPSFLASDYGDKGLLAEKCHELVNGQYNKIIG